MPIEIRYEDVSIRRLRALREELFGTFNPEFRNLDPFMTDSAGIVSRGVAETVSPHYGVPTYSTQTGIDLLIHHMVGQSMRERTGKTPFINEALVANYLTRNSPSVVLLDVGADRLPPVCGLTSVLKRFDVITEFVNDPNLCRFQAAVPFRGNYTDPYSEVQTELVPDGIIFRLQIINGLIHSFGEKNPDKVQELRRLQRSLQHAFNFDGLRVACGNPRDNIADAVPSCISGLVGTVREAALVYEADPSIEIIGLYPYLESSVLTKLGIPPPQMEQIAKGITVRVRDKEDSDRTKLVVDGVITDNSLEDILGLDWRPYMAIGILEYARSRGIQSVIINAENSGSHESVNAFQLFIATECLSLQESRDFTYHIDPKTGNHIFRLQPQHMRNAVDGFPYTHHLEKDSMPEEIIGRLAANGVYRGESYLETWYSWMIHIHNRRDIWDSELRTRFPYAGQRNIGMKPSWNLGRGPMIGMELDVASVLPRLLQYSI